MDQGGTFTDVLTVDAAGTLRLDKVWSDRADLAALGQGAADVRRGTTVATNALLEGTGRPVLLLTTAGLGELAALGDQRRPTLFRMDQQRPSPPVAGVLEVTGRIAADGTVLEPARVEPAALAAWRGRVDAVAIALAHGPLAPGEELRLADACRAAGFSQVSVGHEIAPSRGLLDRVVTTVIDAALSPLLPRAPGHYLRSDGGLARQGLPGAIPGEWRGACSVLSGPAGGVIASADLARALDLGPCFTFDMGGTSTDVSRVDAPPADHLTVGGLRLRVPAVDLETVAAGGGSVVSVRAGLLVVGPQSAGSDPGPACYGRGGPATITDCEAILGRLPDFPAICGPTRDQPLDLEAARRALARVVPEQAPEVTAQAFVAVAHERMAAALRQLAARDGVDPREHTLLAFGGAGPAHACGVAARLGMRRVVVPDLASGFSAYGIGCAVRRAEVVVPVRTTVDEAVAEARTRQPFAGDVALTVAARHEGTTTLLEVPWGPELDTRFSEVHQARFGFRRPGLPVEAVEVRLRVEEAAGAPPARAPIPQIAARTTWAWVGQTRQEVPLLGQAAQGQEGPALLTGNGTSVVVPPGWRMETLAAGARRATLLTRTTPPPPEADPASSRLALTLFASRIRAIAEGMGERLQRLARSVSIRERRDFSCAIFDADGLLVVNAPHVPVHLGAMGETVRDLLRRRGDALVPGQVWVSNDPYAGGSHLPDITVMQAVFVEGERVGFVACRGHHIDVGGSRMGSMPPDSTHIDHEGLLLRQVLLAQGGRFLPPPLPGCREPETVRADLEAQVAACHAGARRLAELAHALPQHGLQRGFSALLHAGEQAASAALRAHTGSHAAREVLDDGTPIEVAVQVQDGHAVVRLSGPPHPGNRNAPTAVARAAVLYVLKVLLGDDLPLNEGAMRAVTLQVEPGSLCDPAPPAAVVGGNVETSQRLVDGLLRALGACAASQGTMNNLTVGTPRGSFYETVAGGGGAGPGFAGLTASQVHMTNTAATDVEELEHRFPVRVTAWRVRRGSGGVGRFRGGDGVCKELELLAPAEVSVMAERRAAGAPGGAGGGPGLPGRELRDRGQGWEPAPRQWEAVAGDRLRIETPGGGGWGVEV